MKYRLTIFNLIVFTTTVFASDSIMSKTSLFVIPHMAYQQETSWSAGIAGGFYLKSNDLSRISSVSGSADYTLLHQFMFNITPKIYLHNNQFYIYSNLNFRNYPDTYYGIGNNIKTISQPYTSQNFQITIQPQFAVTKEWLLGLVLGYRFENTIKDQSFEEKREEIFNVYGSEGWEAFNQTSAGLIINYDSRDNQFYPTKGLFLKFTGISALQFMSRFKTTDLILDIRKFLTLSNQQTFAIQGYFAGVFSKQPVAFQLLPTLGGRDYLRGFRQGMYRDNLLFLIQSEYRLPLYKRLKAAVFFSAGDVANSHEISIQKLKLAYGAGLRYRLNDARVHLRFDISKNNYGEKLQFYITATEAF